MDSVRVGPFPVADLSYWEAVHAAADLAMDPQGPRRFYALHVGGLNAADDREFVAEMNDAELVCADGGSVVLLARLAGAQRIERTPTTDAGWDILDHVGKQLGRKARTALVGGELATVTAAAEALHATAVADIVLVEHGFHDDWTGVLARVHASRPDVIVLGLGAPKEMLWVREHLSELPSTLVVTCGGWFGFLAGTETRAPEMLRRPGLEWIARVAQAPTRLLPRYARGLATCASIAGDTLWNGRGTPASA